MPRTVYRLLIVKLLLAASLAACGAPGSDAVFVKGNPKVGPRDTTRAAPKTDTPEERKLELKTFRGRYYRMSDSSNFQPCGTRVPLQVIGSPEGRFLLAERYRFNAIWMGRPMLGVFHGLIVTDTLRLTPEDSGRLRTRQRFFITGLDSLRPWRNGDCGRRG